MLLFILKKILNWPPKTLICGQDITCNSLYWVVELIKNNKIMFLDCICGWDMYQRETHFCFLPNYVFVENNIWPHENFTRPPNNYADFPTYFISLLFYITCVFLFSSSVKQSSWAEQNKCVFTSKVDNQWKCKSSKLSMTPHLHSIAPEQLQSVNRV